MGQVPDEGIWRGPFGDICAQEYVLQLYRGGWGEPAMGVDLIEPGSEIPTPEAPINASGNVDFSVALLQPFGAPPLDVQWYIDGVQQPSANGMSSFTFTPPQGEGTCTVDVHVEDVPPLAHADMAGDLLRSVRSWTMQVVDADSDGIYDNEDNCILIPNADQRDTDSDGYGNLCDGDLNNDGDTNTLDLNLYKQAHRARLGDANYNADADFNGDDVINTLDLNIYKGLHRKPPGPSCCGLL